MLACQSCSEDTSTKFLITWLDCLKSVEVYSFVYKWGKFGIEEGLFNNQFGVAIDRHGHVFVTDFNNHRIQRFTLNGKFETTWGQKGNAEGDLTNPWGIFVDCDRDEVYVADSANYRIQVFDSNGNYLRMLGSGGHRDGQLFRPTDMAINPIQNDTVFVADMANNRIQVFELKGAYKYKWGSAKGKASTNDGEFNNPISLAFNSKGNLYVADTNNQRIQYFTDNGTYLDKWTLFGENGLPASPTGVTIDSFDNVYVSIGHMIQKFDSTGNFITSFGTGGASAGQLNNPEGIATIEGGLLKRVYVYIADSVNQRIDIFQQELETSTVLPYFPH